MTAHAPSPAALLPLPHALLALAVIAVWGTNFVIIKLGLGQFPPLLFAGLRFALAALPLVFILPRPAVRWRNLAGYGLAIGLGQFGLMFIAMTRFISPGLASLLLQAQVFFTIGLAMWLTHERLRPFQITAALVAALGVVVIATHTDAHTTLLGVLLALAAALCWGIGNSVSRTAGKVNMLAYVAWSSLFAAPPLFMLSLLFEGWTRIATSLVHADWQAWAAVVWQSVGNSIFGYGVWAWLLARHPAASISPFSLGVPVFGMTAAALWLGEPMPLWKWAAAALVLAGLAISVLWPRWQARLRRAEG
ncbi:MAG: EamA family transporter [Burkholderiaceae bacterium]|jgi:O-acetylserine/cysteine efflux transporter|nr:EamA family transporter [Burkholderiaceae bacterium]